VKGRADGRARLQRIRSRCGCHEIAYEYDARGRLEWVRDSAGRLIWIESDEQGRAVKLKLPLSHGQGWYVHRQYAYDEAGDLVRVTDALGHSWRFEYVTHLLVRETDRNGLSFYFQYDGLGEDAWCTRTWGDGGIYDHRILYDKKNKKTFVTNSLGHTTQYQMNLAGLVVKVVDPLGAETKYEYDARTLQRTKEVDAAGGVTERGYDARGNLCRLVAPDGAAVNVAYDLADRPVGLRDALEGRWSAEWGRAGHLHAVFAPTGEQTRLAWRDGLLAETVDPSGRSHRFHYDGRILQAVENPDGTRLLARFDGLGRLVKLRDEIGGTTTFQYDAEGRPTAMRSPAGVLIETRHDAEGNAIESRSASRRAVFHWGHFHKLILAEEDGAAVVFEYDSEGRLSAVVDEGGGRQTFERDVRGAVVAEQRIGGATLRYARDALGRIISVRQGSGRTAKYEYDAGGRIARIERSDGGFVQYGYAADGRLVRARTADSDVVLERDAVGRIVREIQGTEEVRTRFLPNGRIGAVETSLGATAAMERDARGDVIVIHARPPAADSATIGFGRDARGLERRRILPGGIAIEWQRDEASRPIARTTLRATGTGIHPLARHALVWAGEDRIASISEARGTFDYSYDRRGRLVAERGPDQTVLRAVDAVVSVYADGSNTGRRYGPGGRLEQSERGRYEYDEDGFPVARTAPNGERWRYSWNVAGMLSEVARPDGMRIIYAYDAFARRVRKVVEAGHGEAAHVICDTRYIWDGHMLLHEVDAEAGVTTWYWHPDHLSPLAKASGPEFASIVTDHLGVPTEMYDRSGTLKWAMHLGWRLKGTRRAPRRRGEPGYLGSGARGLGDRLCRRGGAGAYRGARRDRRRCVGSKCGAASGRDRVGAAGRSARRGAVSLVRRIGGRACSGRSRPLRPRRLGRHRPLPRRARRLAVASARSRARVLEDRPRRDRGPAVRAPFLLELRPTRPCRSGGFHRAAARGPAPP
jgi:YD repeat-containing protein